MANIVHMSDLILYRKSAEDILDFFKSNTIKNVEFFIEPLDEKYTDKMLKVLENYEYDSITFHGPFRRFNMAIMTNDSWEKTWKSYEESFKIAQKYKPKYMVLHSNEALINVEITEELKKRILEKIDKIVKLGKKYDIEVAVENVGLNKSMIFSQEEYENIILENNYAALIDIGHAFINNWDIYSLIKKLKNNIIGFHLHNNDGKYDQHKSIGEGNIDYNMVIEYIKKETSNAIIVLEYDFNENLNQVLKDYYDISANL